MGKMAMITYHRGRLPYQDSFKALEADIQHTNALWVFFFYFSLPFKVFWFDLGLRSAKRNDGWLWIDDYKCW